MNTNEFTAKDRQILLDTFRQFRADCAKEGRDYSDRDEVERKLKEGGELDKTDRHILLVAVGTMIPDDDTFLYYEPLLTSKE